MKDIFLLSYKVKGIKNFENEVALTFYKKTITEPIKTEDYNIKGIYGMNGSGKSGIVASVDILRNLIFSDNYLNNPEVQRSLDEMINKKTKELYIEAEFIIRISGNSFCLYKYKISLIKNVTGRFIINTEELSRKNATVTKEQFMLVLRVVKGEIDYIYTNENEKISREIFESKTKNLLSTATASALVLKMFYDGEFKMSKDMYSIYMECILLYGFSWSLHIYMDQSDNHMGYSPSKIIRYRIKGDENFSIADVACMNFAQAKDESDLNIFSSGSDYILKERYTEYESSVKKLQKFIRIFKPELKGIDIEKKENGDMYVCSLNMRYETYTISSEFESTGIKKLIKLYAYLQEMVSGGIVFIDELDSNLHDVYLCALLEYLMEYGEGQLCFTTHNVGPMDILKRHKKSIDFLSADNKIYSWKTNGNYSPSKLYRNGMIEGSPFNIDSIDFISVFYLPEDE